LAKSFLTVDGIQTNALSEGLILMSMGQQRLIAE